MTTRNCLQLMLLAMSAFAANAHADVVVIVSAKSHVTRLTGEQTARIFLGKTSSFPDDGDAIPIDQPEGSAIRDEFYSKVVRKDSSQLAAYWAKMIFTGVGRPPVELDGNLAVRKAVAGNPNAIGYIDRKAANKSVRVILAP
ncbi:MAG: phosphate ABC transporter substrate-binding protein [Gallionella sp.]